MNYRCAANAKNGNVRSHSTVFGNVALAAEFCPRFAPHMGGVEKHTFLHTAPPHFLKESLVKNTLPPPDLPLWMYGYIEYLILKIEEGCTCDTGELAQVPELQGGGFRRAYG